MTYHWRKQLPKRHLPKKRIMGWDPRAKRRWITIVDIHDNYFENDRIRALDKPSQRLYFLYCQDFPSDDSLVDIIEEFDIYHYENLKQLLKILDALDFPPVPTSWLMLKWMYINPIHNTKIKLKWRDKDHWVGRGNTMKPRYAVI